MDLNEKLAQRRKEREQKYISEKIHDISNKKSGLPFSLNIILSVISVLVFLSIIAFNYIENRKIKIDIKNAFDHYGVFIGAEYGGVDIMTKNNACMVFCIKKNCQIANFVKIENEVWVVKDVDSSRSMC